MSALSQSLQTSKRAIARLQKFQLAFLLLACFILGGTSQDIVAPKLLLYVLSSFLIGFRLPQIEHDSILWKLKPVLILFFALLFISVIYLIPLSPSMWSALPGRAVIVDGYKLAGLDLPWLPISLTPEKSLFSLFDFLPPLAVIVLVGTRRSYADVKHALYAIVLFVIGSAFLAILQVSNISNALYFYDITNLDAGVGFFSNANHFGVFLVLCLPFAAALFAKKYHSNRGRICAVQFLCLVAIFGIALGVGMAASMASYALLFPVAVLCLYLWTRQVGARLIWLMLFVGVSLLFLASDIFLFKNIWPELSSTFENIGTDNRQVMRETSLNAARSVFPLGSGLGSFEEVYRLFEGFGKRTVPHAHNDYVEIFVEFGLFGLLWLIAAALYLAHSIWKTFIGPKSRNNLSKFMAIVVVTIAIHCTVDYAPRTIAVMVLITLATCLMQAPPKRFNDSR